MWPSGNGPPAPPYERPAEPACQAPRASRAIAAERWNDVSFFFPPFDPEVGQVRNLIHSLDPGEKVSRFTEGRQ